jgi:hypothetical protein
MWLPGYEPHRMCLQMRFSIHSISDGAEYLSELTGGSALDPIAIHNRKLGLSLQRIIRNRYFISYKLKFFTPDGQYHPIDISAAKDGHKLRVYARKGYFAAVST